MPEPTFSGRCGHRRASRTPRYPDTMYVDGLVGPHTVNTMPLETLEGAADHAPHHGADGDA